jgi:hypothetical protein
MADPLSITGLVLAVGQVLLSLYDYGSNVKDARKDINSLSEELFALKGVLEHLKAQHKPDATNLDQSESLWPARYDPQKFTSMLQSTSEFLQSLLKSLEEPKGRFKKSMQSLKWPLDKGDVDKHLARLGRVKTWFILVLMTDSSALTQDVYTEVNELTRSIQVDLKIREQQRTDKANEDLLRWLAPVGPEEDHLRACKARQPGTGLWFIKGPLFDWLRNSSSQSTMLCLRGKCMFSKLVFTYKTSY